MTTSSLSVVDGSCYGGGGNHTQVAPLPYRNVGRNDEGRIFFGGRVCGGVLEKLDKMLHLLGRDDVLCCQFRIMICQTSSIGDRGVGNIMCCRRMRCCLKVIIFFSRNRA